MITVERFVFCDISVLYVIDFVSQVSIMERDSLKKQTNKKQIKVWRLVFLKEWRNLTNILMSLKNNNDRLLKSRQSALTRLLGLTLCVLLSVFPFDF